MRTLICLALVICSCGPASPPGLPFALHGPHQEEFRCALADWNLCRDVWLIEQPDGIPIVYDGADIPGHPADAGVTHLGDGHPLSVEYTDYGDITSTLEHEIGHVLMGPGHYGTGLMKAAPLSHERVTEDDCRHLTASLLRP